LKTALWLKAEAIFLSHGMLNNRQTLSLLVIIALLVVLVRYSVFLVYPHNAPHVEYEAPDLWLGIARNLVSGQGYSLPRYADSPTAKRGPTVVFFFAAVLWLAGDSLRSIVIAQSLADAGTALLLYLISMQIFHDRRVALIAALLFALYGSGLVYTFRPWSEPVFTLFLAGFTWSFLWSLDQPALWRFSLCGGLLGLTVLARPVMQFYPLAVFPLLWWTLDRSWRQVFMRFAVFCFAFAIILLPWVVRNYLVFHAFIPGSSYSGMAFYQSNFTLGQPDYLRYRTTKKAEVALRETLEARFGPAPANLTLTSYAKAKGLNEYQVDHIAFREAIKAIRTYPVRYVMASLVRLARFWFGSRFVNLVQGRGSLWSYPVPVANGVLLGLATVGLVCFRGTSLRLVLPLIILVAYNSVVYAGTQAIARYSVPVMPYVMVFAAFTIVQLFSRWVRMDSAQVQKAEARAEEGKAGG
jgi:4-amino-4-deoxy-L-arabinose transferase-like glycosyltransferase